MWVAEFKVWHTGSAAREVSKKYRVTLEVHYLNVFIKNKKEFVTAVAVIQGPGAEAATRVFVDGVKRQGARNIQREGNQLFFIVPTVKQFHSSVLNANVFFIKPQVIRDGFAFWTVAAWEKKHLTALYNAIQRLPKKQASIELLSLKEQNAPLFASSLLGLLTDKQRHAFELACREGYYAYPRRISLEALAKKAGLAYTTFKDRLRGAEEQLWPRLSQ